ncbi:hypothetical protein [Methylophilus luteus]|uniref:Uncharacterized protein n=1 Tax=Methylophilus luteus TaxID=640108 RepID=A0ABW3F7I4_9PROT
MSLSIEKKFSGIWHRALSHSPLTDLTPDLIEKWATEKQLINPVAELANVGAFHTTPCIVLTVEGGKACFPTIPATGDENWETRRRQHEDQAALWDKVEWFMPLWVPMGKIFELLASVKNVTRGRALELFRYHTSMFYTLPFEAVCIEQILPQARSLKDIVPLAREAYLGAYSGYWATSVGTLIPAIEGSLTRIVSDLGEKATTTEKIDYAINRAIETAAQLHFDRMWVPPEYRTCEYLFGQDERVFAFETFRRWLKNHFFCNTGEYHGETWLNRHMFAHGTVDSWQQSGNFTRMIVALATLAAIESWYNSSHSVSFFLPEMDDASKLLWQQALLRGQTQMKINLAELEYFRKHGHLVPPLPVDSGVSLRKARLTQDCMDDLVRPLRDAGWSVKVNEAEDTALYMTVDVSNSEKHFRVALLYSCATDNKIYKKLAENCRFILYCGAPYHQDSYAYGLTVDVGPVLGWQPPKADDQF